MLLFVCVFINVLNVFINLLYLIGFLLNMGILGLGSVRVKVFFCCCIISFLIYLICFFWIVIILVKLFFFVKDLFFLVFFFNVVNIGSVISGCVLFGYFGVSGLRGDFLVLIFKLVI